MRKAEFEWSEVPYPTTVHGHAEPAEPSVFQDVAGVIWVPDPEQRHWWREVYVKRPVESKPGGIGFRNAKP